MVENTCGEKSLKFRPWKFFESKQVPAFSTFQYVVIVGNRIIINVINRTTSAHWYGRIICSDLWGWLKQILQSQKDVCQNYFHIGKHVSFILRLDRKHNLQTIAKALDTTPKDIERYHHYFLLCCTLWDIFGRRFIRDFLSHDWWNEALLGLKITHFSWISPLGWSKQTSTW